MDVGRERCWVVERANPDEAQSLNATVVAPKRDLALGAAMDEMRATAVGGDRNGLPMSRLHPCLSHDG